MAAESKVMLRCDAPHCDKTLEGADGVVLFDSLEEALDVAEDRDWLITHSARNATDVRAVYCPLHWHRQFGVRTPYWGRRRRYYR